MLGGMKVGIQETKARLSELVRAVQAGEPVVITHLGKPVARLVAYESERS